MASLVAGRNPAPINRAREVPLQPARAAHFPSVTVRSICAASPADSCESHANCQCRTPLAEARSSRRVAPVFSRDNEPQERNSPMYRHQTMITVFEITADWSAARPAAVTMAIAGR